MRKNRETPLTCGKARLTKLIKVRWFVPRVGTFPKVDLKIRLPKVRLPMVRLP